MSRAAWCVGVIASSFAGGAAAEPPSTWSLVESVAISPAPSRSDVQAFGTSLLFEVERAAPGWYLGATWGGTWARVETPSTGVLTALDPSNLGLRGGLDVGAPDLRARLGLRLYAPLALFWGDSIADKRATELDQLSAFASRGGREAWAWQLNVVPAGLDLALAIEPTSWLLVTARAEPMALLSLNSRPSRLALRAELELAARAAAVTGRVGWSYLVSDVALENGDTDQHGASVGLDLDVARGHRVRLDLHVALDGPYGVATGDAKPTWGLVLGARHEL